MQPHPTNEQSVDSFIDFIDRNRLTTAAIFILELHNPFRGVLSVFFEVVSPLVVPLLGKIRLDLCRYILEQPENIELIIHRLENIGQLHGRH